MTTQYIKDPESNKMVVFHSYSAILNVKFYGTCTFLKVMPFKTSFDDCR